MEQDLERWIFKVPVDNLGQVSGELAQRGASPVGKWTGDSERDPNGCFERYVLEVDIPARAVALFEPVFMEITAGAGEMFRK